MTTFTTEDRQAVIQGATGAQYTFMDTRPQVPNVNQIINNICRELQALSTVITSYQSNAETIKILLDAAMLSSKQPVYPKEKDHENACGK